MRDQLVEFVRRVVPGAVDVVIDDLAPIPGGYSRETYRFDARVGIGGDERTLPMILARTRRPRRRSCTPAVLSNTR